MKDIPTKERILYAALDLFSEKGYDGVGVDQIAENAGEEGSVIVEKVKTTGKGFNALTGEYVDMIAAGIVDPAKVTRSALQNAASIAAMVLTTETLVADKPAPAAAAMPPAGMGGGMPPMM